MRQLCQLTREERLPLLLLRELFYCGALQVAPHASVQQPVFVPALLAIGASRRPKVSQPSRGVLAQNRFVRAHAPAGWTLAALLDALAHGPLAFFERARHNRLRALRLAWLAPELQLVEKRRVLLLGLFVGLLGPVQVEIGLHHATLNDLQRVDLFFRQVHSYVVAGSAPASRRSISARISSIAIARSWSSEMRLNSPHRMYLSSAAS